MIHSCSSSCRQGTNKLTPLSKGIFPSTENKQWYTEVQLVLQKRKVSQYHQLSLKQQLRRDRQQRDFFSNSSNDNNNNGTNRKQRRNPSKKQSKADKKIAYIKKSMQKKRQTQRKLKQTNAVNSVIHKAKETSKPVLQPLSDVVKSSKFQSEAIDKLVSFQRGVQNFLLPKSLQTRTGQHRRQFEDRKRNTLVMDGKWWTWNVILALTPASLLACYLEHEKPKMIEFYAKHREVEIKKAKVDAGISMEDDDNLIGTKAGGGNIKVFDALSSADGDDESFMDKIGESVKAMFGMMTAPVSIPPANISNDDDEDLSKESLSIDNAEAHENAKTTPKTGEIIHDRQHIGDHDTTIQELLHRIKFLEEKLNVEPEKSSITASQPVELENKDGNRSKRRGVHHNGNNNDDDANGRKSNIQKRREEERKRKTMEQIEAGQREALALPTKTIPLSTRLVIQHFAEAKINELKIKINKVFVGDNDYQDRGDEKEKTNDYQNEVSNTQQSLPILERTGQSQKDHQSHDNSNEIEEKGVSIQNNQLKEDEIILGNIIMDNKKTKQGYRNIKKHSEVIEETLDTNERRSTILKKIWKWTKTRFRKGDEE